MGEARETAASPGRARRRRTWLLVASLGTLAVVAAWAAARPERHRGGDDGAVHAKARPNVLLVSIDTLRADHTSAYGYARKTTPRLDALLPKSVRFEAAYAPIPITLPSHATMLTGLLPRSHGIQKNGQVLRAEAVTLAELLRDAGYRTAAIVSAMPLKRGFGLAQGFDDYLDSFVGATCDAPLTPRLERSGTTEPFCRRGAETAALAIDWLAKHGYLTAAPAPGTDARTPFFLWLHLFDPHAPYAPVPEHAALFPPLGPTDDDREIAAYDAEVHYADAHVASVLVRLALAGVLDDTLVVITADHGEGLGQHGWWHHGPVIYEEAVRVPLVFRWPGPIAGGRTIDAPVGLVDLAPTVLDLIGVDARLPASDGRSLAPALRDGAALDPERPVFLQRRLYRSRRTRGVPVRGEKLGVRAGRWKYIEAQEEGTRELYDLARDPAELENVVDAHPDEARRLAELLARWTEATPAARSRSSEVAPEDARKLRALGYVD